MKVDREEVIELFQDIQKSNIKVNKNELLRAEQAAVDKEKLTNDPTWNIFLQELQVFLNAAKEQLQSFRDQLDDPNLVDDRVIRNKIFICNERIGTLDMVMNLPKDIIEKGKSASLQLEESEKDS